MSGDVDLKKAISIHLAMEQYQDSIYMQAIKRLDEQYNEILTDDLGTEFVINCARDIASEIVRNCFQTSDFHVTVDQLALRIINFRYDNDYDPLAENGGLGELNKVVYNYNDFNSDRLTAIVQDIAENKESLFDTKRKDDNSDAQGRKEYAESQRDEDGNLRDSITGEKEQKQTYFKNNKAYERTDMEADHVQPRASATYNAKYVKETGKEQLKSFWNSSDNFEMMQKVANNAKSDVRICEVTRNGKKSIEYLTSNEIAKQEGVNVEIKDISSSATPYQLADAVIYKLEHIDSERLKANQPKIEALKKHGYLDENGKVPRSVRLKLIEKYQNSMDAESVIILKNAKYDEVAKTALQHTQSSIGKIIAGQIVYYAAPPLIYEIKQIVHKKDITMDNALSELSIACSRIGNYVFDHLKDAFTNIAHNTLKVFIKSFFDILIELTRATVKRLIRVAKSLVMATVDAVRICANPSASRSEKADAVCNLYSVTITNCTVDIIFEIARYYIKIPEPYASVIWGPLQFLTTIICTNLTMLILKQSDLFAVQYGFKASKIRALFSEANQELKNQYALSSSLRDSEVNSIIINARESCQEIYSNLLTFDSFSISALPELKKINTIFSIDIDFETSWISFVSEN